MLLRAFFSSLLIVFILHSVACSSTQKKTTEVAQKNAGADPDEETPELEISDPLEGYNRAVHGFNDFFFHYFLKPLAQGWKFITPGFLRTGIDNFFNWAYTPGRLVNNLLQAKIAGAGRELAQFSINATMGGLGFYNASSAIFSLDRTNEDTDQTLGKWGIGEGAYFVIPFIGPRTIRGSFGFAGDLMLQPQTVIVPVYIQPGSIWAQGAIIAGTYTVRAVNNTAIDPEEYDNLIKDSIDPYAFIRDIYLQNMRKNVAD